MIKIDILGIVLGVIAGIIALYTTVNPSETIIVYPTPANAGKVQYVDKAGMCYMYEKQYTKCNNKSKTTPVQ